MEGWSFLTNHARVLLCIAHDPGVRQHAAACADPDGLWHWPARHRATRLVTLTLVASAARAGRSGRSARSPAAFGATVTGALGA